jgi:ADP-heptose:LPS heptosyltransferase
MDPLIEQFLKNAEEMGKKIVNEVNKENPPTLEEMTEETIDDPNIQENLPDIKFENNDVPFKDKQYVHNGMTIDELMGKEKPPEDDVFVIIQDGGVGDAICCTPMIESAKKVYSNKTIVVGSAHAEVLELNPNIDHLYHLGSPGDLFEKWVKPLKYFGSVIKRDIYNACAHKLFPGPLSMIYCHLYGVPFEGDNVKIYLSEAEDEDALRFLRSFKSRPVILIHASGGRLTFNPSVTITPNKDWFFDYWCVLVNELSKQFSVVQVGGAEEQQIPKCSSYLLGRTSLRQTAALLKHCLTYVAIDSFVAHAGAAVGKKGVVLFGRSNPYIAGHAINKNVWVKDSCEFNDLHCGRPQGYFGDTELFEGNGRPWVCPNKTCMRAIKPDFVVKKVLEIVKKPSNLKLL